MSALSPDLLELAADMLDLAGEEFARHGCNDLQLPADMPLTDVEALVKLANRANFGDRPESTWPPDDVATAEQVRHRADEVVVMGALAFGLREMAKAQQEKT